MVRGGTFKEAAIEILSQSVKPLHYKDITDLARSRGLILTAGKTPADTMCARISDDLRKHGRRSAFIKAAPGYYQINPEYSHREPKARGSKKIQRRPKGSPRGKQAGGSVPPKGAQVPRVALENQYTGKGGEYLVASRLLFLGYNTSIMAVDSGADLVAIKNEKPFHIQVKTAHLKGNRYSFNITKASVDRHSHGGMFYVFVLRDGTVPGKVDETFLIFPLSTIEEYISRGYLKPHKSREVWTTTVIRQGDNLRLGTRENSVDYNRDKWDIIK